MRQMMQQFLANQEKAEANRKGNREAKGHDVRQSPENECTAYRNEIHSNCHQSEVGDCNTLHAVWIWLDHLPSNQKTHDVFKYETRCIWK